MTMTEGSSISESLWRRLCLQEFIDEKLTLTQP